TGPVETVGVVLVAAGQFQGLAPDLFTHAFVSADLRQHVRLAQRAGEEVFHQAAGLLLDVPLRAPGPGVPQPDGAVPPRSHQLAPVRTERQATDPADVLPEHEQLRAAGRVPQPDGGVIAGRRQPRAVRAVGQPRDPAGVAAEDARPLIAAEVPQPHGAVPPRRRQLLPVRVERHAVNALLVARERVQFAASEVPDAHLTGRATGG